MSNKIPAYAGMMAVVVFQAAVRVLQRLPFGNELLPFHFKFQAAIRLLPKFQPKHHLLTLFQAASRPNRQPENPKAQPCTTIAENSGSFS